jgi:hypothetical protein
MLALCLTGLVSIVMLAEARTAYANLSSRISSVSIVALTEFVQSRA